MSLQCCQHGSIYFHWSRWKDHRITSPSPVFQHGRFYQRDHPRLDFCGPCMGPQLFYFNKFLFICKNNWKSHRVKSREILKRDKSERIWCMERAISLFLRDSMQLHDQNCCRRNRGGRHRSRMLYLHLEFFAPFPRDESPLGLSIPFGTQ